MARRGENIYKRKDGRWEGRYIKEKMLCGNSKYGYVYAKTYSEVKEKLLHKKTELSSNDFIGTISEISYRWLDSQRHFKPSTYAKYRNIIDNHICPMLGKYKFAKIDNYILQQFIEYLTNYGNKNTGGGLSLKSTKDVLSVLKNILYDLFLANYIYAILCDSKFETAETWKRVLNYYCFICEQTSGEILKSRFSAVELDGKSTKELLRDFKKVIFTPLLQLCDTDDLIAVLRLNKYIKDCNNKLLDELSRTVLEKVAYWFKSKETDAFAFLGEFDEENISEKQQKEIRERGDKYCQTVEKVFEPVLMELRSELTRYEMIKESYRIV